jgi:hypothetical protein
LTQSGVRILFYGIESSPNKFNGIKIFNFTKLKTHFSELNAHDTSQGSHYFPIVSARAINPALIGSRLYELPPAFVETAPPTTTTIQAPVVEQNLTANAEPANSAQVALTSFITLTICLLLAFNS